MGIFIESVTEEHNIDLLNEGLTEWLFKITADKPEEGSVDYYLDKIKSKLERIADGEVDSNPLDIKKYMENQASHAVSKGRRSKLIFQMLGGIAHNAESAASHLDGLPQKQMIAAAVTLKLISTGNFKSK